MTDATATSRVVVGFGLCLSLGVASACENGGAEGAAGRQVDERVEASVAGLEAALDARPNSAANTLGAAREVMRAETGYTYGAGVADDVLEISAAFRGQATAGNIEPETSSVLRCFTFRSSVSSPDVTFDEVECPGPPRLPKWLFAGVPI